MKTRWKEISLEVGSFNDTYLLAITTIHLIYDTVLRKIYKYNYK